MHEQAAHGVMAQPAALVAAAIDALSHPDQAGCLPLVGEFSRVLDQQNWAVARCKTRPRRREVSLENFSFLDATIREKAISRLRIRPILAGIGDALAHAVADLPDQIAKPATQPRILEGRLVDLAIGPVLTTAFNTADA